LLKSILSDDHFRRFSGVQQQESSLVH